MKIFFIISLVLIFSMSACTTRIATIAPASEVVIVKELPTYHRVIVKKGTKYYYWNGKYHKKHKKGYVTVRYRGM